MAKIAKRYAAVVDVSYDNPSFQLVDLDYYTKGSYVENKFDEDLPEELIEEIENIGCVSLVDETNFLVYDENYDEVNFTVDELKEILKPLDWLTVISENGNRDYEEDIDTSSMGEFNTDSKSIMVEYVKNNSKAKVVVEDFSSFGSGRPFDVRYHLYKELSQFSNQNHNPSLSAFGVFVTEKKKIDEFLSKLSPENVLWVSQERKTSIQMFVFENKRQLNDFKENSIAYRRYKDYLKEVRSGNVRDINEEKEYTKELMDRDMNDPKFKKSSRYNAQMIISDLMTKIRTGEVKLEQNSILKVVLPENKIVCLFDAKNGIQMLGFQSEEHFKNFADKNLSDKKIVAYNPDASEDDIERE